MVLGNTRLYYACNVYTKYIYLYPSQVENLIEAVKLLPRERTVRLLSVLGVSVKCLEHTHCLRLGYSRRKSLFFFLIPIPKNSFFQFVFCAYLVSDDSSARIFESCENQFHYSVQLGCHMLASVLSYKNIFLLYQIIHTCNDH